MENDKQQNNTPSGNVASTPVRRRNTGGDNKRGPSTGGGRGGERGRGGKQGGRGGERRDRPKPEFDSKIISIRRVARVVAGGRRFSFSVVMVMGDKKGRVGVGVGKATDTALAIDKATRNGKKNMINLPSEMGSSIPEPVEMKYSSARIMMRPALGRGLIAGSAVRTVLSLAGRTDINAKIISPSKNKLNIARATVKALQTFI
ncbi:MAG: 30S ribosomal protein S5 [Candidatus Vogelbacteria bacterium CG10_big_fil_rev_8_21_14_0_10_45_14]|uniref:Small ribosomal subunit protein uS5 n=1 Tax=Candidatus Vogelbacteria bacterium CG10_big_fil_rev_8_21_14_0_10_45_14 TaxID=1975042 RepID=A0A2H0RJT5_9BACT|nr:MAG: 30S ribosomal protein S5 [Candidatus Vogelbacteria bacterium CG10_big_fil_rev_8_21_14_0_10_45_14]